MSFNSSLENIAIEVNGGRKSSLYRHSGYSIIELQNLIDALTKKMWSYNRQKVISNFAFVSAVYEWAAKNIMDELGNRTSGSFGLFEAYKDNIYSAFKNEKLKNYLLSLESRSFSIRLDDGFGEIYLDNAKCLMTRVQLKTPRLEVGPNRTGTGYQYQKIYGFEPPKFCSDIPEPRILKNPVVNLIGKIELSLMKAKIARNTGVLSSTHGKSYIWHLPDDVLCWVLLCFEGAGDEGKGNRIEQWNKKIEEAIADNARRVIYFDFGDGEERREKIFKVLKIPYRKRTTNTEVLMGLTSFN